jgi:hypothetical protein
MGVTEEQAREFIRLVSADVHRLGYLDLQYRPFLRIAVTRIAKKGIVTPPEVVYVPALLCVSNILRNVQSANKLRLKANANAFRRCRCKHTGRNIQKGDNQSTG